jgi:AdoMet-dependent rRNA methyltransferase SPB1
MGPEALLREKIKQRRHREGYEEGLSSSYKKISVLEFLCSATPVEMLGQYTEIALEGQDSWGKVRSVNDRGLTLGEW